MRVDIFAGKRKEMQHWTFISNSNNVDLDIIKQKTVAWEVLAMLILHT